MELDTPSRISTTVAGQDSNGDALNLRRARRGDQEAFAQLYRCHAQAVHSLAWRLTADPQAAEDIVQETFLRLLRWFGGADPDRPLRPWLLRVASNLAIDRLRRAAWEIRDVDIPMLAAQTSEPDAYSEASGLLRHLSPLARALVWLNQVEGWSHRELGKRFGHSESWSKSTVARALTRLRKATDSATDTSHED